MPSRRSHSNSHHGCVQCKAKRVKCDEKQPRCSRCVRRDQDCTYKHLLSSHNPFIVYTAGSIAPSTPSGSSIASPSSSTYSPLEENLSELPEIPEIPQIPELPILIEPTSSDLTLAHPTYLDRPELELESNTLFRYYTTVIAQRSPDKYVFENFHLWDSSVQRHGVAHPFLLSAVLSGSALHIATHSTNPRERKKYLLLGVAHQNRALETFTPALSTLTKENCEAALTCGAMLISSGFAMPIAAAESREAFERPDIQASEGQVGAGIFAELSQIIGLFKGVFEVYNVGWQAALDQHIAPLFRRDHVAFVSSATNPPPIPPELQLPSDSGIESQAPPQELHSPMRMPATPSTPSQADLIFSPEVSLPSDQSLKTFAEEKVYLLSADTPAESYRKRTYTFLCQTLTVHLRLSTAQPSLHRLIAAFPAMSPPLILTDLNNLEPLALVLLAHWAVILHRARDLWWAGGWGRRMTCVIQQALVAQEVRDGLPGHWQRHIEWPMHEVWGVAMSSASPSSSANPMQTASLASSVFEID